jgi:Ribosome recycling factor
LKRLQKESKLTEDDLRKYETEVQKLTDQYVQKVDQILKKKEEEILEI